MANDTGSKVSDLIAEDLAAQIVGEVTTAERDWERIDQNLARWFSGEAILGAGFGIYQLCCPLKVHGLST